MSDRIPVLFWDPANWQLYATRSISLSAIFCPLSVNSCPWLIHDHKWSVVSAPRIKSRNSPATQCPMTPLHAGTFPVAFQCWSKPNNPEQILLTSVQASLQFAIPEWNSWADMRVCVSEQQHQLSLFLLCWRWDERRHLLTRVLLCGTLFCFSSSLLRSTL